MNDDDAARVLFRPSRKRKALRQRGDADNVSDNDDSAVSRAHKASRQRGGVAFTTSDDTAAAAAAAAATASTALIRADDAEDEIVAAAIGIPERFTRQTGLVTTVDDRHIRAPETHPGAEPAPSSTSSRDRLAEHPTQRGKLFEVPLPTELWRTAEQRRQQQQQREQNNKKTSMASSRQRRGRRASEDMKRDQLVDAFLSQNKLDVYDVPAQSSSATASAADTRSADDRMAEEFRRRYYDEVTARRQKRRAAPPARQQQQVPNKDVLKGPKLGGSRNQRAAVRDILLKQEKEKALRKF
ncbi:hypothetical protein AAL_00001 [Moelleriella libera RCEF 2490]|uniref:mRNA splicing factor RNA helicase n=1 Tax=Moelleriella libera RCEF 2490 TaxID=1081109 RepID=A0A162K372_9HYPO|nr:hypothetical protein AAL_00001 [Moelleriella libera RCEF 2490]